VRPRDGFKPAFTKSVRMVPAAVLGDSLWRFTLTKNRSSGSVEAKSRRAAKYKSSSRDKERWMGTHRAHSDNQGGA